jgi:hypothetical protein
MNRLQKFLAECLRDLGEWEERSKFLKQLWHLILLGLLILGYAVPEKRLAEWLGSIAPGLSLWSGAGLIVVVTWWVAVRWDRSRLPQIKMEDPDPDERAMRFDLRLESTEDDELEMRVRVTDVFVIEGDRMVRDTRVRQAVELGWRESSAGQNVRVSRHSPQYAGFLIVDASDPSKPKLFLDGAGGRLPLNAPEVDLQHQKELQVRVVATFYGESEATSPPASSAAVSGAGHRPVASKTRWFAIVPDSKERLLYRIARVWCRRDP